MPSAQLDSLILARICDHWRRIGITLRPGATTECLSGVEESLGVVLPTSMKQLYAKSDGFSSNEGAVTGRWAFRFWPVEEICRIPIEMGGRSGDQRVIFADYLLESHFYAISLCDHCFEEIWIVGGPEWHRVARTFREFLETYLNSPELLLKLPNGGSSVV